MIVACLREDLTFDGTIGAKESNAGIRLTLNQAIGNGNPREEMPSRPTAGEDVKSS